MRTNYSALPEEENNLKTLARLEREAEIGRGEYRERLKRIKYMRLIQKAK